MYYYRRKTSPIKWLIVALIIAAIGGLGYWYYVNYFSKIDFSRPQVINENINQPLEELDTTISANLMASDGDVQVSINSQAYEKVLPGMVLHQQDKIKTADLSNAILKLENGAIIRLGANTEILLQSMVDKKIVIEQFQGRTYHNLPILEKYQVKYQNVFATALGTRFEFITNNTNNFAAVLDFENKVKVEVMQGDDVLLAASLDANEKALVNLKAAKKDLLKIDTFDPKILIKEAWYKWNFDQDNGQGEKLTAEEPDFSTTTDSLELAAEIKASGIYLSWSIYNQDDFKNYKIVRSETSSDLKYPDDAVIKDSTVKSLNSYLDNKAEKGKKYYYRLCVLKMDDKVVCGNVASVENAPNDTVAPAMPLLSANVTVDGVDLIWTANNEEDFKEYRILKSLTNPAPTFPAIGYLAIRNKGSESYLDKEVNITSAGNVYYRVCSLDTSGNSACSNVVTIVNGQVK